MPSPQSGFSFGATADPMAKDAPSSMNGGQDMWSMILSLLGGGGAGTQPHPSMDLGGLLTQLRNDPQGDANRGYVPGGSGQFNPFTNGFFKTADQRKQIEQDRLGTPGFSSLTPEGQHTALMSKVPMSMSPGSPMPFQLDPSTVEMIHGPQRQPKRLAQANASPKKGFNFGSMFQ